MWKAIIIVLESGQLIYIANVLGTTQINAALYTITVVDANNFTLNGIDATGWTTYVSGGIWNTSPVDGQVYIPGSQYAWYRFYSNQFGQYLRIGITYDDTLMNQFIYTSITYGTQRDDAFHEARRKTYKLRRPMTFSSDPSLNTNQLPISLDVNPEEDNFYSYIASIFAKNS